MKNDSRPILYVKSGCPWCTEALSYFNSQGINIEIRDVNRNPEDMDAMVHISGQKKVPTFQYEDFIVADFSVDEFLTELNKFPQICQKLKLGNSEN